MTVGCNSFVVFGLWTAFILKGGVIQGQPILVSFARQN